MSKGKERIEKIKRSILDVNDLRLRSAFAIEACENRRLTLSGCRGISEYGPFRISLCVSGGYVVIEGRDLICDSYTNGGVIVSGYIESICFSLSGDKK